MERIESNVTIQHNQIQSYNTFQEVEHSIVTKEVPEYEQIVKIKKTKEQAIICSRLNKQIKRQEAIRAKIQRKVYEANKQLKEQKELKDKIFQNYTFKDIDLFYRPCFDHSKPFNTYLYYHELARIKEREKQVKKLIDEIKEDKQNLERYKTITSQTIYLPKRHKKLSTCTDPTLQVSTATVRQDTQ